MKFLFVFFNETLLSYAMQHDYYEIVKLLLSNPTIDVNIKISKSESLNSPFKKYDNKKEKSMLCIANQKFDDTYVNLLKKHPKIICDA